MISGTRANNWRSMYLAIAAPPSCILCNNKLILLCFWYRAHELSSQNLTDLLLQACMPWKSMIWDVGARHDPLLCTSSSSFFCYCKVHFFFNFLGLIYYLMFRLSKQ
jgi:hypothetical protein